MTVLTNAPFHGEGAFRILWRRATGRVALSGIAFVLLLCGCMRHEPRADLVILNGMEPESLDPHVITGQADARVVLSLFEGLTRYSPVTGEAEPAIASSWDVSDDRKTYTFHLRTNAAFSTGEPITAQDVIYSWIRLLTPETGADYAGQLFYIRNAEDFLNGRIKDPKQIGIQAVDSHTLVVELNNPTPFFPEICAFQGTAVVPRWTIEKYGDRWLKARPLPCSGAYQVEFWRVNDRIRLRRNPHYWNGASTSLELVDFLPIEQANVALNLYETGGADIIWDKTLIPTELMDVLMKRPDCHVFDYLGTYFIRCNVTRRPFNDSRVRKALALAIDKRRIVDRITRSGEKVASTLTPPGIPHYQPPEGLGHDPEAARRLLAEAGFKDGRGFPSFEYMFNPAPVHEQIAVELQSMWRQELGIEMRVRQVEWKVYLNDLTKTNYDLARSAWLGDYKDPNTFLDLFMTDNGNNRTGWSSAEYDRLMRTANQQVDPDAREKLLQRAETILARDEVPMIPLWFYVGVLFYDSNKWDGIYYSSNMVDEHLISAIRRKAAR